MIEQDEEGFGFTVCCDVSGCSNYEDLDVESFYDAIEELKSLGWKPFKENGEWLHRCPSCCEDCG
jgi:hypothetical protein